MLKTKSNTKKEENFLRKKLQIDGTLSLDKLKKEFQEYLAEKEVERLAKAERKRALEDKQEAKRLEREGKIKKDPFLSIDEVRKALAEMDENL